MNNSTIEFEIKRKSFHLCSTFFPLFYIFISKINMCIFLLIITLITLCLDTYRHSNIKIKEFVDKFFGFCMRDGEKNIPTKLSGASYMAMGLLLSCVLFDKGLAINSWLILIISDCFAAIVGICFGKALYNGKSIEGSVAFFISAVFMSIFSYFLIFYNTSFGIIIISCFVTTLVEFFSNDWEINDNFSIPLTYAVSTLLLNLVI